MEDVAIYHEAARLAGKYQARQSQAARSTATLNVEADSDAEEQIQGSKHDAHTVSSDVSDGSESQYKSTGTPRTNAESTNPKRQPVPTSDIDNPSSSSTGGSTPSNLMPPFDPSKQNQCCGKKCPILAHNFADSCLHYCVECELHCCDGFAVVNADHTNGNSILDALVRCNRHVSIESPRPDAQPRQGTKIRGAM